VEATAFAGGAMFALLERTCAAGAEKLELVAAQDDLIDPARRFPALRLR
jgi:hypothetical protein